MVKCNICGKEFENGRQFGGHITAIHNPETRKSLSKALTLDRTVVKKTCEKCGKEFEIERTVKKDGTHSISKKEKRFCSRSCANGHKQTPEQNKNRSKRLRKRKQRFCKECDKNISYHNKYGYCNDCLRRQSFYRENLSISIKGKSGGVRKGGGHGKSGWYKGYWCDSSWELAFVIYNLENGIEFERNKQGFEYELEGEKYKYYPDFLMEDGSYIEVKGYMDKKSTAKHQQFKGVLKVLEEDDMTPYLKYAINKHGKDYIKLYE